jgi:predicted Zn-dependent peptidase
VAILSPSVGTNDKRRYAAAQLAHCVGDVEGSNLFWSLVETGLAEEAQVHFDGRDGCGEIAVTIVCDPENTEQVESIARDELAHAGERIDDDALLRSRAKITTAAMLASERPMGRMSRLGVRWTYGLPYLTLDQELETIKKMTLENLRSYLEECPLQDVLVARGGG